MSNIVYKRCLALKLPRGQSAFLWGARQTGKSTYLKQHFPKSIYFDLLESDLYFSLLKEPHRLREQLLKMNPSSQQQPIIIDEVQKIPALLDEVHWMIENKKWQFILCGSSARRLKRGHANLLGGRAWRCELYPLVSDEIKNFNLLQALNRGLLPRHYLDALFKKSLKSYISEYLKEEIRGEGLSRNLQAFSKFLDSVAYSNGEMVVYKNIGSDCGVDSKTVKAYYEILIDTHLGHYLSPLSKKKGRKTILSTPKFYLFDVGVANALSNSHITALKGEIAGKSFEHFIFMEIIAYRSYKELDFTLNYWRTKTGLEVDFILNEDEVYLEVKISDNIKARDLRGMTALIEEKSPRRAIVISNEKYPRLVKKDGSQIEVMPWKNFLSELWRGHVL